MKFLGYEITVKKLAKRKRIPNKFGSKRWTKAELDTALRMHNENVPYAQIGKELHRTASAIQIKISKVRNHGK